MAATILNSKRAVEMSLYVVRAFVRSCVGRNFDAASRERNAERLMKIRRFAQKSRVHERDVPLRRPLGA